MAVVVNPELVYRQTGCFPRFGSLKTVKYHITTDHEPSECLRCCVLRW